MENNSFKIKYSQLRLIEPPVNRFLRLIGSKQRGPEVGLLSGVDCNWKIGEKCEIVSILPLKNHISCTNLTIQVKGSFNKFSIVNAKFKKYLNK